MNKVSVVKQLAGWCAWLMIGVFTLLALPVRAVNLVQEFYLPMPEQQIYTANNAIISGTGSTIASTFSIVVTGNGTVIYYDQWEDGYETDLSNPTQPTTQIWGDGNDAHGIPPGFAHNPLGLPAGTVITLTNNVSLPRNPSQILYDARDRIAANKAIIITRAGWPVPTGPVFAGAVSVLSTIDYGTNYISPVGQNLHNNLFKYVGMFIMAAQNNTTVTIDPNGNGVGTTNIVLNQGESYLVNGGIMTGGRVTASKPIQADLIVGHVGSAYASDWFTLYPASAWSSSYYTPVGSAAKVNQPAYVYLYNPGSNAITINYSTKVGAGSFSVPGTNGVYQFQMPVGSGASFVSAGGKSFYALCTVAANNASDTAYNWGFTLVPQGALTTEADAGWAPGSADGTVDGSPVWVTALANTTLYVDYKGDHAGLLTDPSGNHYDTNFTVTALQSLKIYDPSKNQTGMRVYTVDGTLITAAWGEDPDVAAPGNPYIDAGTTVLPFPVPVVKKTAVITNDVAPAGLSIGDTIQYTVEVDNKGLLPLGNTVVIDAPSGNLAYVPNSTTFDGTAIPDNSSGNVFPLSTPGYTIPIILSQGVSTFQYRAQVNAAGTVSNSVNIGGTTISAQAYLAPPPTNGATVSLSFTDPNGVPVAAYAVGGNVFVTMTNAVANTSSSSAQTISVTVMDTNTLDLETITLTETGNNTGIFRNVTGLPTSATSGLSQQDDILNVAPGDALSVSYTDPNFGDNASATALISFPTPNKQLYLSATNGVQSLDRLDPVAYAHGPMRTSADIGSGGGTLTEVSTSTATNGTGGTSMTLNNVVVASGSSQMLLVGVSFNPGSTVSGVKYGGQSLSLVAGVGDGTYERAEIWRLLSPPVGTSNLVITFASTATDISVGTMVLNGVNQSTPFSATNTASGNGVSPSVKIGSVAGNQVFNVIASRSGTSATATGAGQVKYWGFISGATSLGAASLAPGATSVTNTWTTPGGTYWSSAAVSINPAASGSGGPATNVTLFIQTPVFAAPFTLPAGGTVVITNFITLTNGSFTANPAVTATLQANGTNFITLANPTYSATNNTLVWSGVLPASVTIPAGTNLSYVISNGVPGTAFHVNYDSTNAPSVIVLPASSATVIQINSFGIYDAPYPGGSLVTSPNAGATLYIRANVTDPFGSYDITSLGLAVAGPDAGSSFTNFLTGANVVASDNLSKTYEYAWPTGPTTGGYNIAATANEGTEGVTATAAASITTTFQDLGTPSSTIFTSGPNGPGTNSYPANGLISVSVTALDSITNPAVIQTITATVTSSSGDSELLTLAETGPGTGIYTNSLSSSTTLVGAPNDGSLYAPVGSVLTAGYTDPNDPSYSSSANATIQPPAGVPGVRISKTIVSPAGGQTGTNQPVTYNLQVFNTGSTTLTNPVVTDNFPAGRLNYSTASLAPSSSGSGVLAWNNLGKFAPGQSTNFTVTFLTGTTTGALTNAATVNGGTATNSTAVTLQVNNAAVNVVKILLSPTNTPVAVGSNVVFRITIQNVGNTVITSLPMEDAFSGAYFQYVSSTITNNGSGAGSLIWTNLASPTPLAVGATITNDVTMKVVGQGSPANNTATVDFATDIFGNPVPASSSTIGVNTATASINGRVYNDLNQNGVYAIGDAGLANVTLQLYTDPNGDGDPSDGTLVQVTTTDANGYYELLNLNLGHYVVVATTLPGYVSSAPANNRLVLNLTSLNVSTNNNFFQYAPAPSLYSTLGGSVWYDQNGNGTNDTGETNLANVEVDLISDVNSNGLADAGESITAVAISDAGGKYTFAGITPGYYVIREVNPFGYYSTGDSQGRTDGQISFVSTNGIVSTTNNFYSRLLPVAVNDLGATVYATPVIIYPLTNDLSPNGDGLSLAAVATSDGMAVINPGNTNLTFTPTNTGLTTIRYTLADAHGGLATGLVRVVVSPAPLTVSANNAIRQYGQVNPGFSGAITGLVNGDDITATYATIATTNSPAGLYPIVPTLVDPNGRLANYAVTNLNGTLTVDKVLLGITANSTNRLYGAANPVFTFTASGFVNGETAAVLVGAPGLTTAAVTNSPVGTYAIVATNGTLTATNYSFSFTNGTLTVLEGGYALAWINPTSIVYGTLLGTNQNNANTIVAGVYSYNPTNGTLLPAGTNTLSVVFTPGDTNYAATNLSVSLVVTPAPLTITASNQSKVYGQALALGTTAFTPAGLVNGETVGGVTLASAGTVAGAPVGVYPITAGNAGGGTFNPANYSLTYSNGTLTVNPATLTVTANSTNRAYGVANPVFTASYTGFANGETTGVLSGAPSLTTSAVSNSPAGNYPIVATNGTLSATNYGFSFVNGTLTINGANYSAAWTNPVTLSYGTALGTNQNNATATVPGSFVYAPTNGTVLPAGTNVLSVVFTPTDTNYAATNLSVSLVVTPAPLTITAGNTNKLYNTTLNLGTNAFASAGLVNGETVGGVTLASAGTESSAPAGIYPITAGNAGGGTFNPANYSITYSNGVLTVLTGTYSAVWPTPTNIVYGTPLGTNQNAATTSVPGTFTYQPTNGTVLFAGTNQLSVTFAPNDTNYVSTNLSVSLVVLPAPLAVTANNQGKLYGQTLTLGAGQTNFTSSGLVNGDTVMSVTLASAGAAAGAAAGNYPIIPSAAVGSGLTNYSLAYSNGTLTVSLAASLVTWATPTNIVYGTPLSGLENNATSNVPGAAVYNPVNGTVLNAGTNTLTVVYTPTDTNYAATNLSVQLVVTPAPLSVTASNASRVYGQVNPVLGGTISGLQNGDNVTATYATLASTNSAAGSYAIVPALSDPSSRLANYAVATNNGTLTVNPAVLGITANSTNRFYGAANPVFTFTASGFVNGETAAVLVGAPGLTTAAVTNSPVGTYAIVATNGTLAATNYSFSFTNGWLTVNPAAAVVTWPTPTNIVYGTPLGTNQDDATSTVAGTFAYNPTNGVVLPARTNTLTLVYTPTDTNYVSTNLSVFLVVTPAPLTVTANDAFRAAGQTNPVFTGSITGIQNGDIITANYATTATTNSLPGQYPIIPTLADPNSRLVNYNVTTNNGVLTVTNATLYADLVVVQSGPANGVAGSNLVFTVTVTNLGPNTATNIVVTNQLAAGFTYVTASASGANNGGTVIWNIASLPLNGVTNLTVTAFAVEGGSYTNVASGGSAVLDSTPSNNNGSQANAWSATAVSALADVAVFKVGDTNGYRGSAINYTITATNAGPSTATNVVVQDNLPAGLVLQSASGNGTNVGGIVMWPAVTLAPNTAATFNLSLVATSTITAFTNIALSTSLTADPNPTNNDGTFNGSRVFTTVAPSADVVVLVVGPATVQLGSNAVYQITVTNIGPSTASNVVASDSVPLNLTFLSASGNGIWNGSLVTWPNIPALPVGGSTNYTLTLNAPTAGLFTNTASTLSLTHDPNPANNSGISPASQAQILVAPAQLSALAGTPVFNPQTGLFEETVVVTNNGLVTILGFRLHVSGLTNGVTLYNATGATNGVPYVDYQFPLDPSNGVSLILEFYDPTRRPFTSTLTVEPILPDGVSNTSTNGSVAVTSEFLDTRIAGDTRFVIEFTSVPGKTYTVIYSSDLVNWQVATPAITANANVTQWYDDGQPKTASPPSSVPQRFYRVIQY